MIFIVLHLQYKILFNSLDLLGPRYAAVVNLTLFEINILFSVSIIETIFFKFQDKKIYLLLCTHKYLRVLILSATLPKRTFW